ncbi:MAG: efflux RND transporter permease subunit, partial [Candidatus Hydrogenedentes bacterium]|nr:efflux RND transporter permease subunit [Candidatus Hydrogenedentota bacterium]
ICWYLTPLEFIMRLDMPVLNVWVPYPGAAPEEVANQIAIPLEGEFMTISGLRDITTGSDSGGCYATLRFDWGTPMATATADLRDRIERLKLKLPADVDRVYIRRFSSDEIPVLRLALFRSENQDELAQLARTRLRTRLMRVDGVADVNVSGRERDEIYVDLDQNALHSLQLPVYGVVQTLQTSSINVGVGQLDGGTSRFFVRAQDEFKDATELEDQIIGPNAVRLKDVAHVEARGPEGAGTFTVDGKGGVFVDIIKESEANTVATCDGVLAELERIKGEPECASVDFFIFEDQAEIIRFALSALYKAGVFGSILSILILYVFMRRLRPTIIVALVTPASLVLGFIYIYFTGRSLNMVTMAAMLTAIGMMVDNAIVVMENIHRHNVLRPDERWSNAVKGTLEVTLAVTASTLTTVVVFIPVLYMDSGELSTFMKEFAGPVTVALIGSLVFAITLLPLVESRTRERRRSDGNAASDGSRWRRVFAQFRPFSLLQAYYLETLRLAVSRRMVTLSIVVIFGLLTYYVPYRETGMQPIPTLDMRQVGIDIRVDPNYGTDEARQTVADIAAIIDAHREELGIHNLYVDSGGWGGHVRLYLVKQEDLAPGETAPYTTEEVQLILSEMFRNNVPGGTINTGVARASTDTSQAIQVRMRGDDTETLLNLAEDMRRQMSVVQGLTDVKTTKDNSAPEIQVHVDDSRANAVGVSPLVVAQTVDFALRGSQLPFMKKDGAEVPVWAVFQEADRRGPGDLENVTMQTPDGGLVRLNQIAHLEKGESPRSIYRENGKTVASIEAKTEEKNYSKVKDSLQQIIASFDMPQGYNAVLSENLVTLDENLRNFRSALIMSIILIFLVMAALFESWLLPLSILTCVPLAFIGVYWSLYLTSTPVDTVALIGSILMCGVIVNNGIVIVDHINQLRRYEGFSRFDAIMEAGANRIRPVLMTTLTTVLGCLPMAVGGEGGAGALMGIGRALVGGLTAGTLLTLFIVPIAYTYVDDLQLWFQRFFSGLIRLRGPRSAAPPAQ